jgi:hypothetical protein
MKLALGLVLVTTPAFADGGHVGVGVGFFMDAADSGASHSFAEGGLRIGRSPVLVHALAGLGTYRVDEGTGPFRELRAGVELDACSRTRVGCIFAGIDLAWQRATWTSELDAMTTRETIEGIVWRVGADAGNRHVRVRGVLEARRPGALGAQLVIEHRFY